MEDCTPKELKKRHLDMYFQFLTEKNAVQKKRKLSPATINAYHRALSAFYNWLQREEYIEENPMLRVEKAAFEKPIKPTITEEQMMKMLDQFNKKTFVGFRNYCMLLMMYDLGMRRLELVNLELEDVDFDAQLLTIRKSKCRKGRILPIGASLEKSLRRYRVLRDILADKRDFFIDSGRFFIQENGQPVYADAIRKNIVQWAAERVGIDVHKNKISPHTLRHTFARNMAKQGVSAQVLKAYMGHSRSTMADEYVAMFSEDLKDIHRLKSPGDNLLAQRKRGRHKS